MVNQKTIALDFDDTLTAMPDVWKRFIEHAMQLGHKVFVVTARRPTDENREDIRTFMIEYQIPMVHVVFTSLESKLDHVAKRGMRVDIWIDDNPHALVHGH